MITAAPEVGSMINNIPALTARGIVYSIGHSDATYEQAMAAVGQYFQSRRALAMGIAVSGSSLGGVIYPIALEHLFQIPSIEFAWGVRIVGFIILVLLAVACVTVRRRLPPRRGNILVPSAFRNRSYVLTIASLFFLIWGMFTPFFYIETYAVAQGGILLGGFELALKAFRRPRLLRVLLVLLLNKTRSVANTRS